MGRTTRCALQTLGSALLLGALLASLGWFLVHREGLPGLLWVILVLGALGGATSSLSHNDAFVPCDFGPEARDARVLWKLGTLGDMVVGVGGALTLAFLFGGTILKVDFDKPTYLGLLILTSVSFAAGVAGRPLIEAAGQALAARVAKQAEQAIKVSEQADRRSGEAPSPAYTVMARMFRKEGALEAGDRAVDEALRAAPRNAEAHLEKARILKRLACRSKPPDPKKLEQAAEHAKHARDINPTAEAAWYNWACYEALLGHTEKALRALGRAIELEPANRRLAWEDDDLASLSTDPEFVRIAGPRPQA
jgi:tetratricopeptide (TPR) repeat protein